MRRRAPRSGSDKAITGFFGHHPQYYRLDSFRQVGTQLAGRSQLLGHMPNGDNERGVAAKGHLARQQLVEHNPQAIAVAQTPACCPAPAR